MFDSSSPNLMNLCKDKVEFVYILVKKKQIQNNKQTNVSSSSSSQPKDDLLIKNCCYCNFMYTILATFIHDHISIAINKNRSNISTLYTINVLHLESLTSTFHPRIHLHGGRSQMFFTLKHRSSE